MVCPYDKKKFLDPIKCILLSLVPKHRAQIPQIYYVKCQYKGFPLLKVTTLYLVSFSIYEAKVKKRNVPKTWSLYPTHLLCKTLKVFLFYKLLLCISYCSRYVSKKIQKMFTFSYFLELLFDVISLMSCGW